MLNTVYISYFYQIRFFTQDYLPISTAVWDPKWYHDFKGQNHKFRDKRNVLNGVRSQFLHPDDSCSHLCRGRENCTNLNPDNCPFLIKYRAQLEQIDLQSMLNNIEIYLKRVDAKYPVFIVHEAPDNPCSERFPLFDWLTSNNIYCTEWSKNRL